MNSTNKYDWYVNRVIAAGAGLLGIIAFFLFLRFAVPYLWHLFVMFLAWVAASMPLWLIAGLSAGTVLFTVFYLLPFIQYQLAKQNLFWTIVNEGTAKAVMYKGKFYRMLFAKKGWKLDDDGTIIPVVPGEVESTSGLRWVGVWPFYKVHTRTMKFIKALSKPDKDGRMYEERADDDTDFLLAKMPYQYALHVTDAEDKHKLPLSLLIIVTAESDNPQKTLFGVRDWFDALSSRTLPEAREQVSEFSFEELIHDPKVHLDDLIMDGMRKPKKSSALGRNKLDELRQDYGLNVIALEVVNIDPPKEYREVTLRKYVATQTADAEREEIAGAQNRIEDSRIEKLAKRLGLVKVATDANGNVIKDKDGDPKEVVDMVKVRKYFEDNPEVLARIEDQTLDMVRRKRNPNLREQRIANADGSSLDPLGAWLIATISSLRAKEGDDANAVGAGAGGPRKNPGTGGGKNPGGQGGGKNLPPPPPGVL